MSQRITKNDLLHSLDVVNNLRNHHDQPPLHFTIWSPGDGWTRYQLKATNGRDLSRACTSREMYEILYTLINLL